MLFSYVTLTIVRFGNLTFYYLLLKFIKMLRPIISFLFLSISVLFIGCSNALEEENKNDTSAIGLTDTAAINTNATDTTTTTTIAFEFETKEEGGMPSTIVSIAIKGKKTVIKTVSGEAENYVNTDYNKYTIPANASAACGAWYGGQGTYFYAITNKEVVEVYEGWQDEQVAAKEGFHWKKVQTIAL